MGGNKLVWMGAFFGSMVGGFVPALWGAGVFSISSLLCSALGGFAGIWLGWKLNQ